MEGEEGRGWAVGSLTDHGTKFQFYSEVTGSLWRVVSWREPQSDLLKDHWAHHKRPARGQLEGSDGHSRESSGGLD